MSPATLEAGDISERGQLKLSRPFEFVIFVIKFSDKPKNAQPKPRIKTHDSN